MARTKSAETIAFETLKSEIEGKLISKPAWVEAAILALYNRQTSDEQAGGETRHDNSVGFNHADAKRMSFVAEFLKSGKHLTYEKALNVYGPRLRKYSGQLARIALAKKAAKKQAEAPSEPRNVCPRCMVVRCPDGCCCAC
jgi:hypothetical protein